jgi:hypothetical protein
LWLNFRATANVAKMEGATVPYALKELVEATQFEPGSLPLRTRRLEAYARERALNNSPSIAARNAGYNGRADVVGAIVEKKKHVQARVRWLVRDAEDAVRIKRQRLETFLWDALELDHANFYETTEVVITDRNGIPILDRNGWPKTKTVTQPKPLEKLSATERRMIESISYTESGQPNLRLVSKEYAHRELRRMIGGDKVQGNQGVGGTFSNYTDAELFAELGRLANELGIKTTLTIEPKT